jgi:DNA-directed RNA polymerase specialized sigma subunit
MEKKNYYVDKKEMNDEIIKYKETGVISKKLGEQIQLIAERFARLPQFRGYQKMSLWEDIVSEGKLQCIKALKSYDPFRTDKEPNPLSYMSECCANAFKSFLKKHYKNENFKREQLVEYCHENNIPFVDSVGNYLAENQSEKEN